MSSVETQLRDLASYLDAEFPDVGVEELTSPGATRPVGLRGVDDRSSRRPSGWLVAVAAAALALFLLGGAAWLLRGLVPEVADTPVTTTSPSDPDSSFGSGWVPVTTDAFAGTMPEGVGAVVEFDSLLLATGATCDVPGCRASMWTSTDGLVWAEVPNAASVFADTAGVVAASSGSGAAAVGSVCFGSGEGGAESFDEGAGLACRVVAWSSPDGITWSRIPDGGASLVACEADCELGVEELVAAPFGLVARGRVAQVDETGTGVDDSFLLFSEDGLKWTVSSRQPAAAEDFESLLRIGDSVVAFGRQALWSTNDGRSWDQVIDGYQAIQFEDVVVFGDRMIAVGGTASGDAAGRPAAWYTDNGVGWQQAALVGAETGEDSWLVAATVLDESLVALSYPDSAGRVTVWTSPDGLTWTAAPGSGLELGHLSGMPDLVAVGPGLVAVGFGGFGEAGTPILLWQPSGD